MISERSWQEFRDSGLLWWVNRALHLFGWALVVEVEEGEISRAYPARCRFRGFSEEVEARGFERLTEYLRESLVPTSPRGGSWDALAVAVSKRMDASRLGLRIAFRLSRAVVILRGDSVGPEWLNAVEAYLANPTSEQKAACRDLIRTSMEPLGARTLCLVCYDEGFDRDFSIVCEEAARVLGGSLVWSLVEEVWRHD